MCFFYQAEKSRPPFSGIQIDCGALWHKHTHTHKGTNTNLTINRTMIIQHTKSVYMVRPFNDPSCKPNLDNHKRSYTLRSTPKQLFVSCYFDQFGVVTARVDVRKGLVNNSITISMDGDLFKGITYQGIHFLN